MSPRGRLALTLFAVLVLAACGTQTGPSDGPAATGPASSEPTAPSTPTVTEVTYPVEVEEPTAHPPNQVSLRLPGGGVEKLTTWSYCLPGICADGWRGDGRSLFTVGSPEHVDFTFGVPGWDFEATLAEPGEGGCLRQVPTRVERLDAHTFRVFPAGPAREWVVDLFGRGQDGSVSGSFRWTTPTAGELPMEATGSLSVLADHDGQLDSYGVELGISQLDRLPERASATIEVISDNGRATTIDLGAQRVRCRMGAGGLSFDRQDAAQAAIDLGGDSFTYVVHLTMDGVDYTGTAHWPEDTNEEITPAVPLAWTPALPGYAG